MSRSSRRTLLKGLAVTLPAAWSRPVVESIILPVHAQTSRPACSAEAQCYNINLGALGIISFDWFGGAGPQLAQTYAGPGCEGEELGNGQLVVARNLSEAEALLPCEGEVTERVTDPPLSDCAFFSCRLPNPNQD